MSVQFQLAFLCIFHLKVCYLTKNFGNVQYIFKQGIEDNMCMCNSTKITVHMLSPFPVSLLVSYLGHLNLKMHFFM